MPAVVASFSFLDHVGIYLLIAGTCTPIVFTLMDGPATTWCRVRLAGGPGRLDLAVFEHHNLLVG